MRRDKLDRAAHEALFAVDPEFAMEVRQEPTEPPAWVGWWAKNNDFVFAAYGLAMLVGLMLLMIFGGAVA